MGGGGGGGHEGVRGGGGITCWVGRGLGLEAEREADCYWVN